MEALLKVSPVTDCVRGAWTELLLGLTCLHFILDGTGLVAVGLFVKFIFQKLIFCMKGKKTDLVLTLYKNWKSIQKKMHYYLLWVLEVTSCLYRIALRWFRQKCSFCRTQFFKNNDNQWNAFQRVISQARWVLVNDNTQHLCLNNKDNKVLSWPSKVNPLWGTQK